MLMKLPLIVFQKEQNCHTIFGLFLGGAKITLRYPKITFRSCIIPRFFFQSGKSVILKVHHIDIIMSSSLMVKEIV